MNQHRRPDSPEFGHVALALALLSAACATSPSESRESADEAAASADTVSFVGGRPDSAQLEREGRPAAVMVPLAIPDVRKPEPRDTVGPPAPDAPEPVSPDTTRPAREAAYGYRYGEDVLPVPARTDTVPFEHVVDRELAAFDTTFTPETWTASYPADSLARFLRGSGDTWTRWRHWEREGEPCARALRRIPLAGREPALRVALFYPPPPEESLPSVRDTLGLDLERCRLGALWLSAKIEAPSPFRMTAADSAEVRAHLDAVGTVLGARLGPPTQVGPPFLPSRFDWSWNRFWRENGISHLLTYEGYYSNDVEVGVWTGGTGIPIEPATVERALGGFNLPEIRRLVALTMLDTALADSLLSLASHAYFIHERLAGAGVAESKLDAALATTLATWKQAADSLPPSRRAAMLLVADRALELGLPWMDASERGRAAPFEALGAQYHHTLGGSYVYGHNWLEDAFEASAMGPVGDRAFLSLLRRAFVAFGCTSDKDGFRTVIERGERFLAERPGSPVAPEVALEVARAYGDVVAIAWGSDAVVDSYVNGEPFEAEAPEARRSALEFYRMALAGLEDPALRRRAWREAWRLAAGMPPVEAVHVYICD